MRKNVFFLILLVLISFTSAEFASEFEVVNGVLDDGDLAALQAIDGNMVNISEVVGTPGILAYFNLTDTDLEVGHAWNFTTIILYDGSPSHEIDVQIYDNDLEDWLHLIHIPDADELTRYENLTTGRPGFKNSDNIIQIRLLHIASGNINHDLFIDYGAITEACDEQEPLNIITSYLSTGMLDLSIIIVLLAIMAGSYYLAWKTKDGNQKMLGYGVSLITFVMIMLIVYMLSITTGTVVITETNTTVVGAVTTTTFAHDTITQYTGLSSILNVPIMVLSLLIFPVGLVLIFLFFKGVLEDILKDKKGKNIKEKLVG